MRVSFTNPVPCPCDADPSATSGRTAISNAESKNGNLDVVQSDGLDANIGAAEYII
jgi:hypothetical protein